MKYLSTLENIEELIHSSTVCILQFGDESCGPCFAIRERIDRWLEHHPAAVGRYIPIREHMEAAAQMGILSVPTVAVYVEGRQVIQESGYFSLDHILEKTDKYIALMQGNQ